MLRKWWSQTSPEHVRRAQARLFKALLPNYSSEPLQGAGMNAVRFRAKEAAPDLPACVLAHGFGSGLGFFYCNVDGILSSGKFSELILIDWLGMGGSERPSCSQSPYRTIFQSSWCDSHFTTEESIDFFIDPLESFLSQHGVDNELSLVGHSLGGYLVAKYALKYPERLSKLVLASPVGIPVKPAGAMASSQLPTSMRLLDALWSSNLTPQTLVRLQGGTRGKRNVARALRGRIPGLSEEHAGFLSDYLYHITVARPSGEFAMNSLLEPAVSPEMAGVYARMPLEKELENLKSHIHLTVSYGDKDWMRTNEASARKVVQSMGRDRALLKVIPDAGHHLYIENNESFVLSIVE